MKQNQVMGQHLAYFVFQNLVVHMSHVPGLGWAGCLLVDGFASANINDSGWFGVTK